MLQNKVVNFFVKALIIVAMVMVVSAFQSRHMLSTEEQVSQAMLPDLAGQYHQLITPNTPQLIYFYAPWCSVCHVSIENLNYVKKLFPNTQITIIALDYEHPTEVAKFLTQHNIDADQLLGNAQIKKDFKVFGYPSYYFVKNGKVVYKSFGYSTAFGLISRRFTM